MWERIDDSIMAEEGTTIIPECDRLNRIMERCERPRFQAVPCRFDTPRIIMNVTAALMDTLQADMTAFLLVEAVKTIQYEERREHIDELRGLFWLNGPIES